MVDIILPLEAEEISIAVAGGKGANLSRLIRANLPVPAGFVISTNAYRYFVSSNGLQESIERLSQDAADPAAFDDASRKIRELFAAAPMPDGLSDAFSRAYLQLGQGPVAVRSSATAEDLPEASFAGQQDSYLNIRGQESLTEAVRNCWSSLWTARAMAYRRKQEIPSAGVGLAVVVQEMVEAESAGVLFTINPLSGDEDEMLVNATWGLGEALVAGHVNPDSLVLDKASGGIKEMRIGDKAFMTTPANKGTTESPVPASRRSQPALTPVLASELAALCRQVEEIFGSAQDIEWAIAGGRIALLQSRPVTTLTKRQPGQAPGDDAWPPHLDAIPQPFDHWSQMDVGERWPEPVTPLTWSTAEPMLAENMSHSDSVQAIKAPYVHQIQWSRREFGRVYFNEGAMAHLLRDGFGMPASIMAGTMGGQADLPANQDGWRWGTFIRRLPSIIRMSLKWERDLKAYVELFPRIEDWIEAFMARDLSGLADERLWAESQSVWRPRLMEAMDYHAVATASSTNDIGMLQGLVRRIPGGDQLTYQLMAGLNGVIAAEMAPALWRMTAKLHELDLTGIVLDQDPSSALHTLRETPGSEPFFTLFDSFLQRHGHRCMTEAEWLFPRWIEAPHQVIEMIASYTRAGDDYNPLTAEAKQRQEREQATARVEDSLDPLRRTYFRWMLRRAQQNVKLRDNGQHYVVMLLLPIRRIYATLGRRWAKRGWLEQADDFFFLATSDIEGTIFGGGPQNASLDLKQITAQRRLSYEYWHKVSFPEVLGADGLPLPPIGMSSEADILSGIPASGGQATGPAVVINSPKEAGRIKSGQILVTRATDPGWTPIFSVISGLVLEVGGQLSHGAIVAREYGLPAVVNVAEATTRIANGQTIEVDGTTGVVRLQTNDQGDAPGAQDGTAISEGKESEGK